MKTRRAFMVGDESVMAADVKKLARLFFPGSQIQAVSIAIENAMADMTMEDLDTIVFLGHSNGMEYGPFDAKTFARLIANQFKDKPEQRQYVKHLYLVGCEMGLINEHGASLSQAIADNLYHYGFKNVVIHSIAKPEGSVGESLYVEVITRVGIREPGSTVQEGCLNAYLFSQKHGDEFFELLNDKRKNARLIDEFKAEHAFVFLNGAQPLQELNKPHNVFIPNEKLEARRDRISRHPYTHQTKEQARAIALLSKRRDYERTKKKIKLAVKLEFIIIQLERAEADKWQLLLSKYRDYIGVKLAFIELNQKSNTLKLFNYLCKGDFVEAQKIIDAQVEVQKMERPSGKAKKMISAGMQVRSHTSTIESNEGTPLLQKDKSPLDALRVRTIPRREKEKHQQVELSKEEVICSEAKRRIDEMIGVLNGEIEVLSSGCFFFFHRYEINTKQIKITALQQLKRTNSLALMQDSIRGIMRDNQRAMRSWRTARTERLFDMILNHEDELYQVGTQQLTAK